MPDSSTLGSKTNGGNLKAKVYIETSVVSYLTARPNYDIRALANQNITIEWWETQRPNFDLFISEFVIAEVSLGHTEAAQRRLAVIADISHRGGSDARTGAHPPERPARKGRN